tara:strand:- start:871 stop:1476 length:606 start_codon:yes stop_codon:yes gene_type:complete
MACNLTAAIGVDCKDQIGGLKYVYVTNEYYQNIESVDTVTASTFIMTDAGFSTWQKSDGTAPGTVTLYRYALRPNLSSMTINVNADSANGTTFYTQTLSLTLQKISSATAYQLRLLAYARPQIFVQDNNNNVYLLGYNNGCDVTGGTVVSGVAKGDMSGFTIDISAEELAPFIALPAGTPGQDKYPFDGLDSVTDLSITEA